MHFLLEESFALLIILKIQKSSMKMREQVSLIPISIWLSFRFSLWNLCGSLGASLKSAASWELVCKTEFGAVFNHRDQEVNSMSLCFLYSVIWSQTNKWATNSLFFLLWLSCHVVLILRLSPFPSLYFFFRIYFLVLSMPQECNFWLL